MPTVNRPPLSASKLASAFSSQTGWYGAATSTLVPSPMPLVAATAHESVRSDSYK
jgi:hypothetical protein